MTITHIIFSLQVGGTESMLLDIMSEQIELGHDVALIIVNDEINPILESCIHNKVRLTKLKRPPGSKNPYYLLKLYAYLFSQRAEVVHCHNVAMGSILKFYKYPKIITVHTTGAYSKEIRNFDSIVAISKSVHDDLLKNGNCESLIIHNGIDTKKIVLKNSKSLKQSIKILQVGRLDHIVKGQDIAIKALQIIKKNELGYNITLTFIGGGTSEKYLRGLSVECKMDDSIEFLGLKDKAYIYQHLNEYDLFIQPSRYEGFGLTIIEGMAAKVPVLVSNIEGPMEVILGGRLGTSFESGNSNDLAKKILEVISNQNTKRTEEAYQYTLENYSIQKTVLEYITLYSDAIKVGNI